jgi:hypothetical protein
MAAAAGAHTELANIQPRIRAREHKRASIHPRVEHDLCSSSFVRMNLADSLVQLGGEFRLDVELRSKHKKVRGLRRRRRRRRSDVNVH